MYAYPARFAPEPEGGFTVTFRDLPEAITWDADQARATAMARDALAVALWHRLESGEPVPPASAALPEEQTVAAAPLHAVKLALADGMRQAGISKRELARRLGLHPPQIDRLLDPDHQSRLESLERALAAVGRMLVITVEDRDAA